MYEEHWGFRETPFSSDLDPRSFFESQVHEEALARLHYLAEQRRRLGLLFGAQGSGKSLLLEVLYDQLRRAGRPVARLRLAGVSAEEFPWLLSQELGLGVPANAGLAAVWRGISDRVVENRIQQWGTMILLDDVDEADAQLLGQIERLVQLDLNHESRLTMILTAQLERAARLSPRLLELSELRIDLDSWEEEDTADFLQTALRRVGRVDPAFGSAAVSRLHQLSGGVPRRVRQLADWSLMAGAGQQQEQIDALTVESVYEEFGVRDIVAAPPTSRSSSVDLPAHSVG